MRTGGLDGYTPDGGTYVPAPPRPSFENAIAQVNPRLFADALEAREANCAFAFPVRPDASDEERALTQAFLEDVAQVLDARGRHLQVDKHSWRSGGEEYVLTLRD
jgi:hypothetical protein